MTTNKGHEHNEAFDQGMLPVSENHTLYYEQYGRRDGKPVVFLHGGPGGSISKDNAVFFDPAIYRVVLFNQRGAGKSTPCADVRENTTQHLVADIETLREHLHITKWAMVFGGSWGSTLALAYTQAHPSCVGSLVLRGISLGSRAKFEWNDYVSSTFFPELQEQFLAPLSEAERKEGAGISYYKRLTSGDRDTEMAAAKMWNEREIRESAVVPSESALAKLSDENWSISHARIEAHYYVNDYFLENRQLVKKENLAKIAHIPMSIVQGRHDFVCPPVAAWDLHKALPHSKLYFIADAGHSALEPGNFRKLVEICDDYAHLE